MRTVSSSSGTTVAPDASASHASSTDESYAGELPCAQRSPGPMPKRCTPCVIRLTAPRCSISTPLGLPVVPEV